MAFEDEIIYRLADTVVGMKEGEKRQVKLTAQDVVTRTEQDYVARLSRIRKRPKEMKMPLGDYRFRAGKAPEVGQSFAVDPAFPGRVEAVTDQDVLIRFTKPGDVLETPLGIGHVQETETGYEVVIEARIGALIRVSNMVGRISGADDQVITLDFRNPFGGETFTCDVTVTGIKEIQAKGKKEDSGEK
jgi:FKBP-type peptidyl-prolyl cis-trans isomerase 2